MNKITKTKCKAIKKSYKEPNRITKSKKFEKSKRKTER
jgi:hypothetical protein